MSITLTPIEITAPITIGYAGPPGPAGEDGSGGAESTDLSWDASTSTLSSSSGTDAVLTLADATNAGLMSAAQHDQLAALGAPTDYATAAQGSKADTAFSWGDHAAAGYLTSAPVASVAGKTGAVTLNSSDLSDSTATGRAVVTAADRLAGRGALRARPATGERVQLADANYVATRADFGKHFSQGNTTHDFQLPAPTADDVGQVFLLEGNNLRVLTDAGIENVTGLTGRIQSNDGIVEIIYTTLGWRAFFGGVAPSGRGVVATPFVAALGIVQPAGYIGGSATITISGGSATPDAADGRSQKLTANQDFTLQTPTNLEDGQSLIAQGKQDATGGRAVTLGTGYVDFHGNQADIGGLAADKHFLITIVRRGADYLAFITTQA